MILRTRGMSAWPESMQDHAGTVALNCGGVGCQGSTKCPIQQGSRGKAHISWPSPAPSQDPGTAPTMHGRAGASRCWPWPRRAGRPGPALRHASTLHHVPACATRWPPLKPRQQSCLSRLTSSAYRAN